MKQTKQKQVILQAVTNLRTHPTADELYTALKAEHPNLSLGTVYRNLNMFAEQGQIRKLPVPGLGDRFDFRLDPHEHMLCERCGRVLDVEARLDFPALLSGSPNLHLTGYKLMLYGTCGECSGQI